jgi:hypothetical protein
MFRAADTHALGSKPIQAKRDAIAGVTFRQKDVNSEIAPVKVPVAEVGTRPAVGSNLLILMVSAVGIEPTTY